MEHTFPKCMTLLMTEMDLQPNIPTGRPGVVWGEGLASSGPPPFAASQGHGQLAGPSREQGLIYLVATHLPRVSHPLKSAGTTPWTWHSTHCGKEKKL